MPPYTVQVPDFYKLHLDEELRLQAIKEQNRQHLTQPKEFHFGSVHHRDHAGRLLGFASVLQDCTSWDSNPKLTPNLVASCENEVARSARKTFYSARKNEQPHLRGSGACPRRRVSVAVLSCYKPLQASCLRQATQIKPIGNHGRRYGGEGIPQQRPMSL